MGDFILLGPGGYFVLFFLPHWVPHLSQSSIFAIATSLPCWSTFEGVSQSTRRSTIDIKHVDHMMVTIIW